MARPKKLTLGDLIDQGAEIKDRLDEANKVVREIQKQKTENQEAIIAALEAQGITSSGGAAYTASVSEEEVFNIDDYEALSRFVVRNKATYLFQRRLSTTAVRELIEQKGGKLLPGLTKAKIKKLSFRKKPK